MGRITEHFTKEDMQMANRHWRDVRYHFSLGNWKSKQEWDNITHILKWLKLKKLTLSILGEDVKQQELQFINDKNANDAATLVDSSVVFHKTKHSLPHNPAI